MAATLTPSSDSDIKVEVWLPATGWNRKLQAVGNGGWAGVISYGALAEAVQGGYATASTDTGHSTPGGGFVAGASGKADRFRLALRARDDGQGQGDRAGVLRRSAAAGPTGTAAPPAAGRRSRKRRCFRTISTASSRARRAIGPRWRLWIAHALLKDPASHIPAAKYPLIHKAALDGVRCGGRAEGRIDRRSHALQVRSRRAACARRATGPTA